MAGAQGIRAGRAYIELFADSSALVRGLKKAQQRLQAFGASLRNIGAGMVGVGAMIGGPFLAAAKTFASTGDALDKMALRTQTSVEFLSALSHAADIGGTSIGDLETGIRRLQRSAMDASRGLATQKEAFDRLGVSVTNADGSLKSTEALFMETAAALADVENNTEKAALASMLFGRAGTKLLPMLNNGAAGLNAVMKEAEDLGIVMSGEDATAAAELTDAFTRLTSILKMAVVQVGGALAPALTVIADTMQRGAAIVLTFVNENQRLIKIIAAVAAGLVAGGIALVAMGTVASSVMSILGLLAGALGVVGSILGALLSPIGVAVVAIRAIGISALNSGTQISDVVDFVSERFDVLKADAMKAWKGIADALSAGNIELAAKVLWLGLKMEWQRGVASLNAIWQEAIGFLSDVWSNATFSLSSIFVDAIAAIETAWIVTVDALSMRWRTFTDFLSTKWTSVVGFIRKAWTKFKSLFDEDVDVDAEFNRIDRETRQQNRQTEDARRRDFANMRERQQNRRAEIERNRRGTQDELGSMREQEQARREAQTQRNIAATQAELDQAKRDFQASLAEAEQAAAEAENEDSSKSELKKRDPFELSQQNMQAGLGQQQAKSSVLGTFNAAAVRGFGASSAADRTARATEKTAKNTDRLVRDSDERETVFL